MGTVKVALISPNYGRCRAYKELQFSSIKRITGGAPFRVVVSRKPKNGLMNGTKDKICPENLLGQRHERDQDNNHKTHTRHPKIYFKENILYFVIYARSKEQLWNWIELNMKSKNNHSL